MSADYEPEYLVLVAGERIDHADTEKQARVAADAVIYGGIGTPENTTIVPNPARKKKP